VLRRCADEQESAGGSALQHSSSVVVMTCAGPLEQLDLSSLPACSLRNSRPSIVPAEQIGHCRNECFARIIDTAFPLRVIMNRNVLFIFIKP